MSEIQTTRLGRNWLLKTLLFLTLLLCFGCWGLADALYFYPKRGEMDAARQLKDHLVAADGAGKLTSAQLKVTDPAGTYAQLKAKESELLAQEKGSGPEARAAQFELTRLKWLDSLNRMWALKPEPRLVEVEKGTPPTRYYFDMAEGKAYSIGAGGGKTDVPVQELTRRLVNLAATTNQVTPLSGFDMLFQWVFVVIGFGGGLWMLITLIRAAAKKYSWKPQSQELTLHDGKTATPADIRELDKTLWHKFFVVMHLKDGRTYKLDLLRYQPLEDWVLAMERTAFPELSDDDADKQDGGGTAAAEPAPTSAI